jgi:hypothetical protein
MYKLSRTFCTNCLEHLEWAVMYMQLAENNFFFGNVLWLRNDNITYIYIHVLSSHHSNAHENLLL